MKLDRKIRFSLFILSIFLVVLATLLPGSGFFKEDEDGISNAHWMVSINGKYLGQSKSADVMSDFNLSLKRGDVLAMSTVMPDMGDLDFPTLYLQSRYSGFNVYLDGKFYKSYNMEDFRNNRYIGRSTYMISLPKNYVGKILRLEIFTAKDGIRATITHTALGEYLVLEGEFIRRNLAALLCGSAMIMLGMLMILISAVLMPYRKEIAFNLYAGALFSTIGLGLHSYYGITSLYVDIFHETEIFESVLLLMVPLLLIYVGILYPVRDKALYYITIASSLILFFGRIYMHAKRYLYLGFAREPAFLQYFQTLPYSEYITTILVSSASLFFLLTGLYRFFRASSSSLDTTEEYGRLTQVAYEDPLTGLMNRGGLSIEFDDYDRNGTEYYIIHFDVNDLKKTNDTYGHQMGDELLCCFATCLDQVFGKSGVCSRQGGDEFTVLLRTKYDDTIVNLFEKLDRRLEAESKKRGLPFTVRAAHGYSFRANFKSIHEASMAADQHMYECKHRMKKSHTSRI